MQVAGDAFALFFLRVDEAFAQAGQSGLRMLPFGDIHQTVHPAHQLARGALDRADVWNQDKLRAVSPLDRDFHGVWGSAGSQSDSHGHFIKIQDGPGAVAHADRFEKLSGQGIRLWSASPKRFRRAIELPDVAFAIASIERQRNGVHELAAPELAFAQSVLGGFAVGDVRGDAADAAEPALGIEERKLLDNRGVRAIRKHSHAFKLGGFRGAEDLLVLLLEHGSLFERKDLVAAFSDKFLSGDAECPFELAVHKEVTPLGILQKNIAGTMVEKGARPKRALGQGRPGFNAFRIFRAIGHGEFPEWPERLRRMALASLFRGTEWRVPEQVCYRPVSRQAALAAGAVVEPEISSWLSVLCWLA